MILKKGSLIHGMSYGRPKAHSHIFFASLMLVENANFDNVFNISINTVIL